METKNCKRCGAPFYKKKKISQTQWKHRTFCSKRCAAMRINVGPELMSEMYLSGLSCNDIASKVGCSAAQVIRILKQYGTSMRNGSERVKLGIKLHDVPRKISEIQTGRALSESAKEKLRAITGDKHHSWKGGMTQESSGYIVYTSSPSNGNKAGMLLHRVIAEQKYGRKLGSFDYVHHIDGNKKNNHPDNLIVLSPSEHAKLHAEERKCLVLTQYT